MNPSVKEMLRIQAKGSCLYRCLKSDSRTSFGIFHNAFKARKEKQVKPETGFFGFQELAEGEKAYEKLTDNALAVGEKLLQEAYKNKGRTAVIEKLDELSNTLCKVADMADFVRFVHPPHSAAAGDSVARISSLVETLNTDVKLYELLAEVMSGRGTDMDPETFRVGSLLKYDFEQSGIHLSREKREECVKINDELLEMGQNFMNGTAMPVALPEKDVKKEFSWIYTPCVDSPGFVEITQPYLDHDDPEIRRIGYQSFFYNEQTQATLLESLILKRHRLAELCGFAHYSHKVSQHSAIGSSENVSLFLETLNRKLINFSSQEFRQMKLVKDQTEKKSDDFWPWDVQYYLKQTRPFLHKSHQQYFSLPTCMEGLNTLCSSVFGILLEIEPTLSGEVWHPTVQKLAVKDIRSSELLGFIFCDFFARDSKPRSDCHFTIRGGKRLRNGEYQVPIVALLCNFTTPENPADKVLLGIGQVENLFHEMGHALHSMVARTRFQHVSGTRCVTDFAEVPSNLLEFFTHDDRVLRTIAKHHETGQQIPDDLLEDLQMHRKFGSAAEMQHQLLLATYDHKLHSELMFDDPKLSYKRLSFDYYPNVDVESTSAFHLRFGHLVGYGAKYYTYLYCKAIATKIWIDLFHHNPFSEQSGADYKNKLLVHGGGRDPGRILESLLGANPSIDSLTDSLISSL
ncbi:mitochondrial intermediate peptidase-like [Convolutriloba macropyga]|uniref:mitochondrial intermediate peptidase-like n=1 Tax=Convolutriloba macropyga TaxID=536237 RepID=UPI003F52009B